MNFDGSTFLTALCPEINVFRLVASVEQRKFHFPPSDVPSLSHRDSIMSEAHYEDHIWHDLTWATRRKASELKTYHLPYSTYKHDTIDSADPSVADPGYFAIFLSSLLIKILLIQVTLETTAEDQLNDKNKNPSNAFLGWYSRSLWTKF